jgi:hypothetical protein
MIAKCDNMSHFGAALFPYHCQLKNNYQGDMG